MPRACLIKSLGFATRGIVNTVKKERNIKIHLTAATIAVFLGFFFKISKADWLALLLLFAIILSGEVLNSVVEGVCDILRDRLHLEYSDTTFIRDAAAGSVWIVAIFSVIVGLVIFLPYFLSFLRF